MFLKSTDEQFIAFACIVKCTFGLLTQSSSRNLPPPRTSADLCSRFLLLMENRFQILASCIEETPRKIVGNNCFLNSFSFIPQARTIVFGKSSVDIAHFIIERVVKIDLSVFSSSDPFVCYKRLLRFEKAKTNLPSLQRR